MAIDSEDPAGPSFFISAALDDFFEMRYYFRALQAGHETETFPHVDAIELFEAVGRAVRRRVAPVPRAPGVRAALEEDRAEDLRHPVVGQRRSQQPRVRSREVAQVDLGIARQVDGDRSERALPMCRSWFRSSAT